jgi:hypothetical protein
MAERWTRYELVTVAMALDEFRDEGVPKLFDRVNGLLRSAGGDEFLLVEASEVERLREALKPLANDLAEARMHHEQGKWSDEAHREGLERIEHKVRVLAEQKGEE